MHSRDLTCISISYSSSLYKHSVFNRDNTSIYRLSLNTWVVSVCGHSRVVQVYRYKKYCIISFDRLHRCLQQRSNRWICDILKLWSFTQQSALNSFRKKWIRTVFADFLFVFKRLLRVKDLLERDILYGTLLKKIEFWVKTCQFQEAKFTVFVGRFRWTEIGPMGINDEWTRSDDTVKCEPPVGIFYLTFKIYKSLIFMVDRLTHWVEI